MASAPNIKNISVSIDQAEPLVMKILKPRLVPELISSPGIGKSALAYQIAEKYKLCVIDIRLSQADPADLNGFPFILSRDEKIQDRVNKAPVKASYVPMEVFPVEGDEIPEGYAGWLLLMDEFNSAPLAVQAAAYKIVLDRMVGMHRLHPKCLVMAAGNLSTDKAIVNRQGTAMQSRLIHLPIHACLKAWMKWADRAEVDYRVKAFLNFKPDLLHKFDPNHSELTFPCPRTWDFMSKIIKPIEDVHVENMPILAGTVGEGAAREFHGFIGVFGKIPTFSEILANPQGVSFGDEPSMQYALAGMLSARMNKDNAQPVVSFLSRLGIDFQVIALRAAIVRDRSIKKEPAVKTWLSKNMKELVY